MKLSKVSWAHLSLLAGLFHFFLIAYLGLSRHWGYLTSINDLGIFDQAVWGILNDAPFLNSNNPFGVSINWLGYHFNPILLAFTPFYWIYPAAEWLILFQAAAISITAWPLYLIAKRVVQSDSAAFMWAVAYLVNPFVLNAAVWDFHPVSLAAPFMALGVLAVEKQQSLLLGLVCLFLLLVQEHFGIAVAGFGVLWWLRNRSSAPAVLAFCAGVAHTLLVLGVIMPALSPTGDHIMMAGNLGQLSRYGWLGNTPGEIILNVISHPLAVTKEILIDRGGAKYLVLLLAPLLFTPLAGFEILLPGLADLAANLLSSNSMPRGLLSYHSISLVPLLVAGGIYGSSRIASKWRRCTSGTLSKLVLWGTLIMGYFAAPLPLPYAQNQWQPKEWAFEPERAVSEIRRLMPPGLSISAQGNVGAQFSQRHRIFAFPKKINDVDMVVLRLASPTMRTADGNPAATGSLGHHLLLTPNDYLAAVENVLNGDAYGIVYWNQPWLVLSKEKGTSKITLLEVRQHLAKLEKDFVKENKVQAVSGKTSE